MYLGNSLSHSFDRSIVNLKDKAKLEWESRVAVLGMTNCTVGPIVIMKENSTGLPSGNHM